MGKMKVNAIVQARCGSTRLPNKVFLDVNGYPLLWHVVNRLTYAKQIDNIIIATTESFKDDQIEKWCKINDVLCFRGSEDNVLNRYYSASVAFPSDVIVRITADDPFKEPAVIDKIILKLINGHYDLVTNNFPPSYPEGLDCEAFTFKVLGEVETKAETQFEREHVTQYVYHNVDKFKVGNVTCKRQLASYRWTIDTEEDYHMVQAIYEKRKGNAEILLMDEILSIIEDNPDILHINGNVKRSTMYQ